MLLCCQVFFEVCGAHGEKDGQSHVFTQLVSGALWVTLFKIFPGLDGVWEVVYFGDSSRLQVGHTEQPIFAIVPNLVLLEFHGQLPELLLPSLRSRKVAVLDPSRL